MIPQPGGEGRVPGILYLTEVKHQTWAWRVWAERELRAAGYERVEPRRPSSARCGEWKGARIPNAGPAPRLRAGAEQARDLRRCSGSGVTTLTAKAERLGQSAARSRGRQGAGAAALREPTAMPTVFVRSSHPHGLGDHPAATFVTRLGAAVAQAYRVRRDTRQLMAYGDAMLHDIGVGRGEVERAVRTGRDRG